MNWKRLFSACMFFPALAAAQNSTPNNLVKKGNDLYREGAFEKALELYSQALKARPDHPAAGYNNANALFRTGKYDEAAGLYADAAEKSPTAAGKSQAYYNQGVAFSKNNQLEPAIEAYKNALRNNPADAEARENLQKALQELKKQQQQQQQKQDQQQQEQKDQKKEKEKQQQPKQEQQDRRNKMTMKDVEQKLKSMEEKEKQLRDKLQQQKKAAGGGPEKDW